LHRYFSNNWHGIVYIRESGGISLAVMKLTHPAQPEQDAALAENHRRPLVRAEVIARHFDVHVRTVHLWAERGDIPCVRIGGAVRFNMEAVLGAAK
jgi:hypothetical protein